MTSPGRAALALRLGAFVLGGIALALGAVVLLIGGWFQRTEAVEMRFRGSVQGLVTGAPVVLRGVPVGYVKGIGLAGDGDGLAIPVQAQLRPEDLGGATLQALLDKGLVARLATRSLLSGQLYVELDLRPEIAAAARQRLVPAGAGRTAIPTAASWQEGVQEQLEALDLRQLSADLSATLTSVRTLMQSPDLQRALAELASAGASVARLSAQLEQRLPALVARADGALAQAGGAFASAGQAAERVGQAAERGGLAAQQVGAAASSAQALLAPDAALAQSVRRAADELAASAVALRAASQQAEPTLQGTERALDEVARAARAVRELADMLERDPQALLRGKRSTP